MKKKKIKVVEFTLDDQMALGLTAISLVDRPAIESNFVALSSTRPNDKHRVHFDFASAATNEERRILCGPILIPDKLILRASQTGEEYYMRLSADTIRRLAHSYQLNYLQASTKVDHKLAVNGCFLVETWMKEFDVDKSVGYGMNEPVGTWFGSLYVGNDAVWAEVKAGTYKGFSVEVDLVVKDVEEVEVEDNSTEDEMLAEIEKMLSHELMSKVRLFLKAEITNVLNNKTTFAENEWRELMDYTQNDNVIKEFKNEILALWNKFMNSGQSGGSAPFTAGAICEALKRLFSFMPLTPVTEEGFVKIYHDEKHGDVYQHSRLPALFKDDTGAYYLDAVTWIDPSGGGYFGMAKTKSGEEIHSSMYIKSFPFEPKNFKIVVSDDFVILNEDELKPVFEYYNKRQLK